MVCWGCWRGLVGVLGVGVGWVVLEGVRVGVLLSMVS